MRRVLLAALLCAALPAYPTTAAPAPQLMDPRGDTPVPSYDVVSGRLWSLRSGRTTLLRADLTLGGAPLPGAVTDYDFGLVVGCDLFQFRYTWRGAAAASDAIFGRWDYCYRDITSPPEETVAVDVTVRGSTLTWQVPYTLGLRRGMVGSRMFAGACYQACTDNLVPVTDSARRVLRYVVGSDLPRR